MPAQYVKAYIKRNKHDAADAEAICEAFRRPTIRFVPVKTADQQATQLLHRGREQLVRQRTMLVNALRAHLAEFGLVAAQGLRNVGELIAIIRDDGDRRLPAVARQVLQVLANQIEQIEAAVAALERQLLAWHKTNPVSQRLASIPGIDRSSLRQSHALWQTQMSFAPGGSSPPGWAWCRGRTQPGGKFGWAGSRNAATVICAGCLSMGQVRICCDRGRRKPIRG